MWNNPTRLSLRVLALKLLWNLLWQVSTSGLCLSWDVQENLKQLSVSAAYTFKLHTQPAAQAWRFEVGTFLIETVNTVRSRLTCTKAQTALAFLGLSPEKSHYTDVFVLSFHSRSFPAAEHTCLQTNVTEQDKMEESHQQLLKWCNKPAIISLTLIVCMNVENTLKIISAADVGTFW